LPIEPALEEALIGNGQKRADGLCPLEPALPIPKTPEIGANGRMGEESTDNTKDGGQVDYEYSEDE